MGKPFREVRPYDDRDEEAVLHLLERDRLPGQPVATAAMIHDALAGRSEVDAGWWEELEPPVTSVAVDGSGAVVGVMSCAVRPKDGAGLVLWLHCGEDQAVAEGLLGHALERFGPREVHAFDFASALTLGLEALPVKHRSATVKALTDAGFVSEDLWRYMRRDLPATELPRAHACTVTNSTEPAGKRLEVREDGKLLAEAVIGRPQAGIGVLWWISVEPPAQGRGLGRALLGSALDVLAGLGAQQVILFVDDDAPADDPRDRTPANRMYERAGFTQVDRLHSFLRPKPAV
ncbi:GNAT family N-acetyltransferase [Streptomyces litchfieldiae]|uniref:GNAT family N-acetyltransferase n=1 Tax=Streptomyces litchfieldiae TaxID=3075543 RepID=A0ABU2N163_9ACTN|nr:GNAT family N-acetyltransferase [Streptomyces sp. DSM 44938]MDT0347337.1 GNAT family N-acetyltransferase [Streptomyces sp. DSM 44938]